MAYSKKILLTLLLALGILFLLNSNVFAYSFVGKDGQLVTTANEPQYAESPLRLITYYDGYYYFMCPNVPNQSGWYWYTDQSGQLANSFTTDSGLSIGMYCVRIAEGDDYGWHTDNVAFGEIPETLFYENITFNASPIYDHYGSSLIIKPPMANESQDGMQQGIEALTLALNGNAIWNVFFVLLPFVAIIILFNFGYRLVKYIQNQIFLRDNEEWLKEHTDNGTLYEEDWDGTLWATDKATGRRYKVHGGDYDDPDDDDF